MTGFMTVTGENISTLRNICPSVTLFTSWSVGGLSVHVKYIQLNTAFARILLLAMSHGKSVTKSL